MKNAMQLKAVMRNIAKEKNISVQLVLQNYMLERFLERVSVSDYQDNFIIKGGFLIASMVGLDSRTTMDMDATIKRYPMSKETSIVATECLYLLITRQWQYRSSWTLPLAIESHRVRLSMNTS